MPIYHAIEARASRLYVQEWRRGVLRVLALLHVTLAACAVGLFAMDSTLDPLPARAFRAVWNALNLVTTLGDFSGLDQRSMIFIMGTMVAFMMIGGYAISSLTGIFSGATATALRGNRRMEHKLDRLSNHVIIIGFGPAAALVANRLREAGEQVVIVERTAEVAAQASSLGYLVVQGDAGKDSAVFDGARIKQARALVVTTDDPDRKLSITLMAHSWNPKLKICVTGANNPRGALLQDAGASEVVVVDELVAAALVDRLGSAERP